MGACVGCMAPKAKAMHKFPEARGILVANRQKLVGPQPYLTDVA
jgi:hypothetical protein